MPRGRPRTPTADPTRARRSNGGAAVPFNHKLALHRWLLSLFGVQNFEQLAEHLEDEALEGLDENNIQRFHHAICLHLPADRRPGLPNERRLGYDQAIVSVTQQLNNRRITRGEAPIVWKYFQYLALLFTKIYLDRYFRDLAALRDELNTQIRAPNQTLPPGEKTGEQVLADLVK